MRVPQDINPGDTRHRDLLAARLINHRESLGITRTQLAGRLGVSINAVTAMETRRTWAARIVQAWARALDAELAFGLLAITVPDYDDVYSMTYQIALETLTDPAERDKATLHLVHRDLQRARWYAGITDEELAHRFGVTSNTVRYTDGNPEGITINGLQRYARALGGRMRLRLTTQSL